MTHEKPLRERAECARKKNIHAAKWFSTTGK